MRTYEEIMADASDEVAFSNGTSGQIWMARWCWKCAHDTPELIDAGNGCPIILACLMDVTPKELTAETEMDATLSNYSCSEFVERPEQAAVIEVDPDPAIHVDQLALEVTP